MFAHNLSDNPTGSYLQMIPNKIKDQNLNKTPTGNPT